VSSKVVTRGRPALTHEGSMVNFLRAAQREHVNQQRAAQREHVNQQRAAQREHVNQQRRRSLRLLSGTQDWVLG